MLENIAGMFGNMNDMLKMKNLKKKTYEANTILFRETYGDYFQEMFEYVEQSGDKETAAEVVGKRFAEAVQAEFANKRGKIDSRVQVDLNFFMIYYVFPTILGMEKEDSKLLADAICKVWGRSFKDSKIQYTDYDTVYAGFREKIFGIF